MGKFILRRQTWVLFVVSIFALGSVLTVELTGSSKGVPMSLNLRDAVVQTMQLRYAHVNEALMDYSEGKYQRSNQGEEYESPSSEETTPRHFKVDGRFYGREISVGNEVFDRWNLKLPFGSLPFAFAGTRLGEYPGRWTREQFDVFEPLIFVIASKESQSSTNSFVYTDSEEGVSGTVDIVGGLVVSASMRYKFAARPRSASNLGNPKVAYHNVYKYSEFNVAEPISVPPRSTIQFARVATTKPVVK
jgi:hypothetical protein